MAKIIVADLVNHDLCEEVDLRSFVSDLSEEQIGLRGGMCVLDENESSRGCSDVIIDFPRKIDLSKIIYKRK